MTKIYVAIDENGNIVNASTSDPSTIIYAEKDIIPDYRYEFELTWEQIDELWRYKVVNSELVLREGL